VHDDLFIASGHEAGIKSCARSQWVAKGPRSSPKRDRLG
jgi:hypothetical protein